MSPDSPNNTLMQSPSLSCCSASLGACVGGGRGSPDPNMEQAKVEPRSSRLRPARGGPGCRWKAPENALWLQQQVPLSFIILSDCVLGDLASWGRKQGGPLEAGVAWRVGTWTGLFIWGLFGFNVLVRVASHPQGQGWLM